MPKRSRDGFQPDYGLHIGKRNGEYQFRSFDTHIGYTPQRMQTLIDDLAFKGYENTVMTYASDMFPKLEQCAMMLIERGKAYVDFSKYGDICSDRILGIHNSYRNTSVEFNKKEFEKMRSGQYMKGMCFLRLKIDYAHTNYYLRDPVAYDIDGTYVHPRHKKQFFIYPTYEYGLPILDAMTNYEESYCHAYDYVGYKYLYHWIGQELGFACTQLSPWMDVN